MSGNGRNAPTKPCGDCGAPISVGATRCVPCYNAVRHGHHAEVFPMNGQARQEEGFILSLENAAGERLVLIRSNGPMLGLLRGALADALAVDETFRVVAYCTPETVYSDVQGRRGSYVGNKGASVPRHFPEASVLARIGRLDMLHPRLATRRRPTESRSEYRTGRTR